MSNFESDGFFEDEEQYDYDDDYLDGEENGMIHDQLTHAIPAELMNRWKASEVNLEHQKINLVVMKQVVAMLEKSWFWRFRTLNKKMSLICDAYYVMLDLVRESE